MKGSRSVAPTIPSPWGTAPERLLCPLQFEPDQAQYFWDASDNGTLTGLIPTYHSI